MRVNWRACRRHRNASPTAFMRHTRPRRIDALASRRRRKDLFFHAWRRFPYGSTSRPGGTFFLARRDPRLLFFLHCQNTQKRHEMSLTARGFSPPLIPLFPGGRCRPADGAGTTEEEKLPNVFGDPTPGGTFWGALNAQP